MDISKILPLVVNLKGLLDKTGQLIKDSKGKTSSKRIAGLATIAFALSHMEYSGVTWPFIAILGIGSALLLITPLEKTDGRL